MGVDLGGPRARRQRSGQVAGRRLGRADAHLVVGAVAVSGATKPARIDDGQGEHIGHTVYNMRCKTEPNLDRLAAIGHDKLVWDMALAIARREAAFKLVMHHASLFNGGSHSVRGENGSRIAAAGTPRPLDPLRLKRGHSTAETNFLRHASEREGQAPPTSRGCYAMYITGPYCIAQEVTAGARARPERPRVAGPTPAPRSAPPRLRKGGCGPTAAARTRCAAPRLDLPDRPVRARQAPGLPRDPHHLPGARQDR